MLSGEQEDGMAETNILGWLDGWIDENIQMPGSADAASQIGVVVARCRADAEAAGISTEALYEAAGGDLSAYILGGQTL
jgi:hypothetical protein